MSTFRSQAINIARSQPVELGPGSDDEITKTEHYGYLGRIINPAVEAFLSDVDAIGSLSKASSVSNLDLTLHADILGHVRQQMKTEEFRRIASHVNAIHVRRVSMGDDSTDLETLITRGLGTFVHTFTNVYGALQFGIGREAASHPDGALIVDRLAKLPLEHMLAFGETFFRPEIFDDSPLNVREFIAQLEPSESGGWQFRRGYPQSALIPINYHIDSHNGIKKKYRYFKDSKAKPLAGFPLSNPAVIGCPLTFEPTHGKRLWQIYATARRSIELRDSLANQAVANTLLDTAEPSPQTASLALRSAAQSVQTS